MACIVVTMCFPRIYFIGFICLKMHVSHCHHSEKFSALKIVKKIGHRTVIITIVLGGGAE